MSLIGDQQRKNAQQKQPTIKPLTQIQQLPEVQAAPVEAVVPTATEVLAAPATSESNTQTEPAPQQLELGGVGSGQEFQLSEQANAPKQPIELLPPMESTQAKVSTPADYPLAQPVQPIKPTIYAPELAPYDPTIVTAKQPMLYDTSANQRLQDDNRRAQSAAIADTSNRTAQAQQRAQEQAEVIQKRTNTPQLNVPQKQRNVFAQAGQAFTDILFGNQQAQSNERYNITSGEFGKSGDGLGGLLKYTLSLPWNTTVATIAEVNQATADGLEKIGVPREQAQRFARGGFIGLASDVVLGKERTSAIGRTLGVQQDWERTRNRNVMADALYGESTGDLNDPEGNRKGVFYRANRPMRTQAETAKAASSGVLGGVIQATLDDPFGAGYEIFGQLMDPFGNFLGDALARGLGSLGKRATIAPTASKPAKVIGASENVTKPTKAPRIPKNSTNVTQQSLPPVVKASAQEKAALRQIPEGQPASVAAQVGIGSPNTKITSVPDAARVGEGLPDNVRAQEIGVQKQLTQANMSRLDDVFSNSYDFGRRAVDELPQPKLSPEGVAEAIDLGIPVQLPIAVQRGLARNFGNEAVEAFVEADYSKATEVLRGEGRSISELATAASDEANAYMSTPTVAAPERLLNTNNTSALPTDVYHGTALADWTPSYNIRESGSRGELGYGIYTTRDQEVAQEYARALVGDNAPVASLEYDSAPNVVQLKTQAKVTLDARANVPSNDVFYQELLQGLPDALVTNVKKSLARDATASYTSFLNKLESNLVRSGMDTGEQTLRETQAIVSDNLRRLGYDSVYDGKSGFGLLLTNDAAQVTGKQLVQPPANASEAIAARYNADAYAARYYQERLTTDANLRDSAYKVNAQLEFALDEELAKVQQRMILANDTAIAASDDGVLPRMETQRDTPSTASLLSTSELKTQRELKSSADLSEELRKVDDISSDVCGF